MQNALNQKRAVDGALKTRLRDTPLRDATTTPTPTRTQHNAYTFMEKPPQWLECDGFIYCRVNVAKALIARDGARFAAAYCDDAYSRSAQVPHGRDFATACWNFINHDQALSMELWRATDQASLVKSLPSAACAAASRAIGTRNGEHDT